ncbi:MAG: LytTR family transcriptional regulator DNA-binding domain-containing protein, partial [Blastocatellia bacterium]|nr:LytTR family transcriptional regulator DNA-binding domain-containing protein [Blastocatellia bacterium]
HLPSQQFLRIHRSVLINIEYIERIEPWFRSSYQIYLRNITTPLTTSRKYSSELRKKFF